MARNLVYVASSLCWGLVVCAGAESVMAQRVFDNQDPFFQRGNQIVEQEARRLSSDASPREVIINRPNSDQPLNDVGTNTPNGNGNNNTGNSGQNVPVNVAPAEPVDYGR
ncbi:MAG: hypothetical protein WCO45_13825 [Pseudanabaena sp. ELA607]